MATIPFDERTKQVIAQSRLLALDLGYDYISTLHLFLADCQLYPLSSLKGLLFKNEAGFQQFYQSLRIGQAIFATGAGSLPLLVEAETTLRQAGQVGRAYGEMFLHPCHLVVAAMQLPASLLHTPLITNGFTIDDALSYYVRNGQLGRIASQSPASQGLMSRVWQALRG